MFSARLGEWVDNVVLDLSKGSGTGGHVATDQGGGAAAVKSGTRGATRHNWDAVDVAVV